MFQALVYEPGTLRLIDQRTLPREQTWIHCLTAEDVAQAIESMVVRGAPAIGCAAAYGLALEARRLSSRGSWGECRPQFQQAWARLSKTRPTAVNLFYALDLMKAEEAALADDVSATKAYETLEAAAQKIFDEDLGTCRAIGRHGLEVASGKKPLRILTHCNTGSLATAGYGTALGVIRAFHEKGLIDTVYADETRPYLQGSRLTAYELEEEGIPYQIVVDSAAAALMAGGRVDLVVVGADRIIADGSTANKIGTYSLAVQCHYHGVPFYVAAPTGTLDFTLDDPSQIPVEERDPDEVRGFAGRGVAPAEAGVFNPSFDVTPGSLVSGIITEKGIFRPPYRDSFNPLREELGR